MGRASHDKQVRRERERQRPNLEKKLREQFELLTHLGAMFDGGVPLAALPLAVVVRVLVHDTKASRSLLEQLGLKDTVAFMDTAAHPDPNNLLPSPGLVLMRMVAGVGADWVAPLNDLAPPRLQSALPFVTWWTMPITKVHEPPATWSRKSFVLHITNKEGGAHIDPAAPEETIQALEEGNLLGWTYSDPLTGDGPMLNGPILPSIRQIGHELEVTIRPVINAI